MPASRGPRSRCKTRKIIASGCANPSFGPRKTLLQNIPATAAGPGLLVEAATVCDDVPNQKRDLLEEASRLTNEEPLKRRIADDLRRVDLLGKPFDLKMSSLAGGEIDLANFADTSSC